MAPGTNARHRPTPGAVTLVVAAHVVACAALAGALNVWVDEAYTLRTTAGGPAHAFQQALQFELQPPVYFVALGVWRLANGGIFWARLFSVLCTSLAVLAFVALVRRAAPRFPPVAAAVAFAFHPWIVWAAVEARPYALAVLLATALAWLFTPAFLDEPPRPRSRAAYAAVAACALGTQYYLGAILAAGFAALFVLRRWTAARAYVFWMLLVGAATFPLALVAGSQVAGQTGTARALGLAAAAGATLESFEDFIFSSFLLPGGHVVRWACRLALLSAVIFAIRRRQAAPRPPAPALAALAVVVVCLVAWFTGLMSFVGRPNIEGRHMLALLPLGLALLFGLLARTEFGAVAAGAVALVLAANTWSAYARFAPLAKRGDYARVAAHLMQVEGANQPILIFPPDEALALAYHYTGRNRIVPLPAPVSPAKWDARELAFTSDDQARVSLASATEGTTDCWLVTPGVDVVQDVPLRPDRLESAVSSSFVLVAEQDFALGTVLRRLHKAKE